MKAERDFLMQRRPLGLGINRKISGGRFGVDE